MLEQENAFYDAHQAVFREKYLDKWLVITGESLWGVYDKFADAAKNAVERLEPGEFIIHRPSDDDTVIEIPTVWLTHETEEPAFRGETTCTSGDLVKFPYAL